MRLVAAFSFTILSFSALAGPYAAINGSSSVIRNSDGVTIPADPGNSDWQAYQAWKNQGNAPDPAPTPPKQVATFTLAQLIGLLTPAEQSAILASNDVKVRAFLLSYAGTSFTMAQIKTGLDYLVSQNLLTSARENAILSTGP